MSQSHRDLEASAARLSALLDADVPDAEALKAARWDIAARIMQHMTLEDRHLFGNLAADPRPEVAAIARRNQAEFEQHIASYGDHAKWWTAERVLADWDGYRAATRTQLGLLAARIEKVEIELFPLARAVSIETDHPTGIRWTRDASAIRTSIFPQD